MCACLCAIVFEVFSGDEMEAFSLFGALFESNFSKRSLRLMAIDGVCLMAENGCVSSLWASDALSVSSLLAFSQSNTNRWSDRYRLTRLFMNRRHFAGSKDRPGAVFGVQGVKEWRLFCQRYYASFAFCWLTGCLVPG